MRLNCLGTSSSGNSYLVASASGNFLLDCGIPLKKISQNININNIDFAFCSHVHKDHSSECQNLTNRGVLVIDGYSYQDFSKIYLNEQLDVLYEVLTFPIKHDDCKNSGCIVIDKQSHESILYLTDFNICEYDLSDFNFDYILIECNYSDDIMNQLIARSDNMWSKYNRQIKAHMGLKGLQIFLDHLNLKHTKEIILCHTSDGCGDPMLMQSTIYTRYGKRTGICKRNGGIDYCGRC